MNDEESFLSTVVGVTAGITAGLSFVNLVGDSIPMFILTMIWTFTIAVCTGVGYHELVFGDDNE